MNDRVSEVYFISMKVVPALCLRVGDTRKVTAEWMVECDRRSCCVLCPAERLMEGSCWEMGKWGNCFYLGFGLRLSHFWKF